MHVPEPIAKFVKDGKTRLAHTIEDVVQLRFDGWREVTDEAVVLPAPEPTATSELSAVSLDLDDDGEADQS